MKAKGFKDGKDYSIPGVRGVFFSDEPLEPLDMHGGLDGYVLVMVEIPDEVTEPFEWKEEGEGKGYREWCIPANIINEYEIKFPDTYRDRGIYKVN